MEPRLYSQPPAPANIFPLHRLFRFVRNRSVAAREPPVHSYRLARVLPPPGRFPHALLVHGFPPALVSLEKIRKHVLRQSLRLNDGRRIGKAEEDCAGRSCWPIAI